MSLKYLIPSLGAAALLISACAPFRPYAPGRRSSESQPMVTPGDSDIVTSPEQEELREAREQASREAEARRNAESRNDDPASGNPSSGGGTTKPGGSDYRRAVPIPGKEGFVFNPFTNNPVDVRGIPSGSLVYDPQDPNKDRNRFRVP